MPGLTVDTETSTLIPLTAQDPALSPAYSPITPTFGTAQLATTPAALIPRRIYTHTQEQQTFIPHPEPLAERISLEENPDAIAVRAALSILQIQRQNALNDIRTLQAIGSRARSDPETFAQALVQGDIKSRPDPLFGLDTSSDDDGDMDLDEKEAHALEEEETMDGFLKQENVGPQGEQKWPYLPTPQNVVRLPPINWDQYGVMGESLEKLHADQVSRPVEGHPARLGADGRLLERAETTAGLGTGCQRQDIHTIAAPYTPGKDKLDRRRGQKA